MTRPNFPTDPHRHDWSPVQRPSEGPHYAYCFICLQQRRWLVRPQFLNEVTAIVVSLVFLTIAFALILPEAGR
jgi:hypothetical protein